MENNRYIVKSTTHNKPYLTISCEVTDLQTAMVIALELQMAFRSTEIMNNATGEIMYQCYYSDECFTSFSTPDQAIQAINKILGGNQNNGDN